MTVRLIEASDCASIQNSFSATGWSKPEGYFAQCHGAQERGEILVFVAWMEGVYAGHVRVLWESQHSRFSNLGIPEINDLVVLPVFRKRGIGSRLIDAAESAAFERSDEVGISVGLHPGYNAAQRMYGSRGYVPTGGGVTYQNRPVVEGQAVQMDDSLLLHMTKRRPHRGSI